MNFKLPINVLVIALLSIGGAINIANAGLITTTYENKITTTYDDGSQETWLQFDQTSGLSVEDFFTGNNNTFLKDGWYLASNENMAKLLNNFFDTNFFGSEENYLYLQFFDTDIVKSFVNTFGNADNNKIEVVLGGDLDDDSMYNLLSASITPSTEVFRHFDSIGYNERNGSNSLALFKQNVQVPEPSTLVIMALGIICLVSRRLYKVY